MRASTKTMLVATATIGLVAACTPPLPPDVLAARAERTITCVEGNQEVAVDPVVAEAVDAVGLALQTICPEQSITAVPADQVTPVRILDRPPTAAEIAALEEQCTGDLLVTPVFGTPIVLAYNIVGLEGLLLTPEAVAGIISGRITTWADPLIAEPNDGFDIPDIPVLLQRLESPSGSVEAMTAWLTQQVPDIWTEGQISTLTAGAGHVSYDAMVAELTGASLDEGFDEGLDEDFFASLDEEVIDDATIEEDFDLDADLALDAFPGEGTIAILPAFLANLNVIPIADFPVNGEPVSISNVDLPKVGIASMGLVTDEQGRMLASHAVGGVPVPEQFDLASAKVIVEPGQELVGWPVIAMSTIAVCDEPNNPLPLATGQFLLRLGGQGTFDTVGLTPLPEPVRVQAIPAMRVVLDNLDDDSIGIEEESPAESTD